MSVKKVIIEAGERYANLTPAELRREAHVFGKMYESCYIAAAKDLVKAANFLTSNDATLVKVVKAAYTMVLPFSATVMENAQELRQEFADEYDNKHNVEPVMADETPEEPANNPNPRQVNPKQAVTAADLAAGTVRRGVILSRSRYEQNL